MCGILLAPDHYDRERISLALASMEYRGPDDTGIEYSAGWVLGHVRLAIQTPLNDPMYKQPAWSSNGRLTAFVGEIFGRFNAADIDEPSDEMRIIQKAMSSTKLKDFHDLDGFWAVADVDPSGRARALVDHLGIKPLYYWREKQIVCSELEPMFKLEFRPPLNKTYLANCIKFGYDYTGDTPYEGIHQLLPGQGVCMQRAYQISFPFYTDAAFNYWDWKQVPLNPSLYDSLKQAIIRRASDSLEPVALLLSGGLDSSIIYYTLKAQGFEPWAYSIENGESEFLPPGVGFIATGDTEDSYAEADIWMQAPLDLGSLFPQMRLAKALSTKGVRVCLSGDGADELFGGYRRAALYDSQASDVFCELPFYHLPRLDRIMMRKSIELRSPFLAPSVVAHALKLPYSSRTSKQALKKAFEGVVPNKILARVKHPLKSSQVLADPLAHRIKLMEAFYARLYR